MNCLESLCAAASWLNRTETLAYFGGICLTVILLWLFHRLCQKIGELRHDWSYFRYNIKRLDESIVYESKGRREMNDMLHNELIKQREMIFDLQSKKRKK